MTSCRRGAGLPQKLGGIGNDAPQASWWQSILKGRTELSMEMYSGRPGQVQNRQHINLNCDGIGTDKVRAHLKVGELQRHRVAKWATGLWLAGP